MGEFFCLPRSPTAHEPRFHLSLIFRSSVHRACFPRETVNGQPTNYSRLQYSTEGKIKEPNLAAEAGAGLLSAVTSYARGDMRQVVFCRMTYQNAHRGSQWCFQVCNGARQVRYVITGLSP